MAGGIPVVISERGFPVTAVESGAPLMSVAENGFGVAITLVENAAPFIIEGLPDNNALLALSSDDGSPLADDDEQLMETY